MSKFRRLGARFFLSGIPILMGCAVLSSCQSRPQLARYGVPSSETLDRSEVSGTLVLEAVEPPIEKNPSASLRMLSFPSGASEIVRTPDIGSIHSLSGPDNDGRVVYIENHFGENRFFLKRLDVECHEDSIEFEREGDPLWDSVIGDHIAISPSNGLVAFVAELEGIDLSPVGGYTSVGRLEIWNLDRRESVQTDSRALDFPMSWFPDGARLAYVEPIDCQSARTLFPEQFERLTNWLSRLTCTQAPAISVLDVRTGEKSLLALGRSATVSESGRTVIVRESQRDWIIVRETGEIATFPGAPGFLRPIALSGSGLLVYWGLPTDGTAIQYTKHNSPLVGPKLMLSLKAARLGTGEFITLVPYIDPRSQASFGALSEGSR